MKTILTCSVLLIAACQSSPDFSANGALSDRFTVTRLRIHPDGSFEPLASGTMTREQQLEAAQRRASQSDPAQAGVARSAIILNDFSCAGSDLWLFDQANTQGNELCLQGVGDVSLASFVLGGGTWAGHVRSYWPGASGGYFYGRGGVGGTVYFSAWQAATNANAAVQADAYLHLDCDNVDFGAPNCP